MLNCLKWLWNRFSDYVNVLTLLEWLGWKAKVSAILSGAVTALVTWLQGTDWYVAVLLGLGVGLTVGLIVPAILISLEKRRARKASINARQSGKEDVWFHLSRQQRLREKLKEYASQDANVEISFASVKEKVIAETLASVFNLSGWQTNLTNIPLERQRFEYIAGTEVHGFNRHLVDAVVTGLKEAGFIGVRQEFKELQVKRDNPKWSWCNQSIRITIGHQEQPKF